MLSKERTGDIILDLKRTPVKPPLESFSQKPKSFRHFSVLTHSAVHDSASSSISDEPPQSGRHDQTLADISELRERLENIEAERSAFLQEGVFDLIQSISKQQVQDPVDTGRSEELEKLRQDLNDLRRQIQVKDAELTKANGTIKALEMSLRRRTSSSA